MVRRLIFSSKKLNYFNYEYQDRYGWIKPNGLWYSYGTEWLDFLAATNETWAHKIIKKIKYIYKIELYLTNILKIKTLKQFKLFTHKYGIKRNWIKFNNPSEIWQTKSFKYPYIINWNQVAKDYHGIDIKYKKFADRHYFWFNRWDCSSGCVWNFKAIKQLNLKLKK